MAEAAGKTKMVPKVGDYVKIVFHGYYEGESLGGRPGYEIGTEHEVTSAHGTDFCLNDDIYVLPEEIEVIK